MTPPKQSPVGPLTKWAVGLVLTAVTAGSAGYVMGFDRKVERLDTAQQAANVERAVLSNEMKHLTVAVQELHVAVNELNRKLQDQQRALRK